MLKNSTKKFIKEQILLQEQTVYGCIDDTPGPNPDINGDGGYAAINYDPNATNPPNEYGPFVCQYGFTCSTIDQWMDVIWNLAQINQQYFNVTPPPVDQEGMWDYVCDVICPTEVELNPGQYCPACFNGYNTTSNTGTGLSMCECCPEEGAGGWTCISSANDGLGACVEMEGGEHPTEDACLLEGCGPNCPGFNIITDIDWPNTPYLTVETFCGRCEAFEPGAMEWGEQNGAHCECCEDAVDDTEYATDMVTGCDGFNHPLYPQDFRDLICSQCADPQYTNIHCECCQDGINFNIEGLPVIPDPFEPEGMPGPQGMPTINTPGAPNPKNYKGGTNNPKYITDKNNFLKQIKKTK